MKRLADMVLSGIVAPSWWTKQVKRQTQEQLNSRLPGVEKFLIDNVMAYFYSETTKDQWGMWDDFPNIAPPFESFWMEGFYPSYASPELSERSNALLEGLRSIGSSPAIGVGYWVQSHKIYEDREWWGWAMTALPFIPGLDGKVGGPTGMVTLPIDKHGRPTKQGDLPYGLAKDHIRRWGGIEAAVGGGIPAGEEFEQLAKRKGWSDDDIEKWKDYFVTQTVAGFLPFMLALSFIHCKNVSQSEVSLTPRRHRKQTELGSSRYTYKVLDINPMKKVLKTEGQIDNVGLKKALHICRGHFATYTEDAPLFGRVTGTFWKEQHLRGDPRAGVVEKDYCVHPPKED